MPEPIQTPTRLALESSIVNPASATAIFAEATAYCVKRSIFRASLFSICTSGSKSFTSAATLAGNCSLSNRVKKSMPERPDVKLFHIVSTSLPPAVTAPSPATTTRHSSLCSPSYSKHINIPNVYLSPPLSDHPRNRREQSAHCPLLYHVLLLPIKPL